MGLRPVGDVSLERTDTDTRALLGPKAETLALGLLGADPSGHAGEGVVPEERIRGTGHIATAEQVDELRDVDPDRAAVDALGVLALEAALGLEDGEVLGEPEVDFLERVRAPVRVLLRHRDAVDRHPLARIELDVLAGQDALDDLLGCGRSWLGGLERFVAHRVASVADRSALTAMAGILHASRLARAACSKDR